MALMITKSDDPETSEGLRILARIIARAYLNDSLALVTESKARDGISIDESISRTRRDRPNGEDRHKS